MIVYHIVSIYFFVMILSVVYWASIIRVLNRTSYTQIASLLSLAICFYIFGYTMELNADTPEHILFWNRFEYLGIPYVSALWLTVSLIYTGHFRRHKLLLILAIYVVPVITMVLRFTNDWHHLYFANISYVHSFGQLLLVRTFGPWMYVQTVHSMSMIFLSFALFIHEFRRNQEQAHGKIHLIAVATVVAAAGLVMAYLHPFGFVLDYMAVCLPFSCLMVIIAIIRYDFLDVKSLARSKSFDSNQDALLLISRSSRIIDYNRAARVLFDKASIDLSQNNLADVFSETPAMFDALQGKDTSVVQLSPDGEARFYEISTGWVGKRSASQASMKTIRDVTEAYKLNQSLRKQAMMDELSGLYNRRAFVQMGNEVISQAIARGELVCLLMMDLDHFKAINDQYGHQTGDFAIMRISRMLHASFIENSLIARLGGEEFGVLLTGYTAAQVTALVTRFVAAVAGQSYTDQGKTYRMTVSVGVGYLRDAGKDLYGLMLMADKALYRAKEAGRNQMVQYDEP